MPAGVRCTETVSFRLADLQRDGAVPVAVLAQLDWLAQGAEAGHRHLEDVRAGLDAVEAEAARRVGR